MWSDGERISTARSGAPCRNILLNQEELSSSVHKLKGMLATLAARPAYDAARKLESLARSGDLSGAGEALTDLEREIDRVGDAMHAQLQALDH